MDSVPKFWAAAITAAACLLAMVQWLTTSRLRRQFIRAHNCAPAPRAIVKDPFFALDVLVENVRATREHRSLRLFEERFYKYGPTYTSRLPLGRPITITMDPENLRAVLPSHFKDYGLEPFRKPFLEHFLGEGIFLTDGEKWAASRALLRPSFARDQIADLDVLEKHISLLFRSLPRDGATAVDLQEHFFRLTLDTATEFLFGHSTDSLRRRLEGRPAPDGSLDSQVESAFAAAQHECMEFAGYGPLARFAPIRSRRQVDIVNRWVDRFVDQAVQAAERHGVGAGTGEKAPAKYRLLPELAERTKDRSRLRRELLNVLVAGRDTTASLLGNLFFEVSKRPDVWAELEREVGQLEGRAPSYEELRGMPYVRDCIPLRLHPVVPANTRVALCDTVLPRGGGTDGQAPVFVARGEAVGWSIYAMHRRRDLYGADAHDFRPGRWAASGGLRPGWAYLPFNGGPRLCLGQQYALTEAAYTTVRMVQEYAAIESRCSGTWVEKMAITACSLHGTRVVLSPRHTGQGQWS